MSKLRVNEIAPISGPQVSVGGPATLDPSILFNLQSTTQGFAPPRMTTAQRNAIASPADGLLVFNTDSERLEEYAAGQWTVAGNGQQPVVNVLRVVKNPVLNSGDFSSVTAALASITTNSPTNPFIIEIGPGVFAENQIVMKPYVYISGMDGSLASVLTPVDPNAHFVIGTHNSSLAQCTITGVTGSGDAAIYLSNGMFGIDGVTLLGNNTGILVEGFSSTTPVLFANKINISGSFVNAVVAKNSGAPATITLKNTLIDASASVNESIIVSGSGTQALLGSVSCRSALGGSTGIKLTDGAFIQASGLVIANYSTAFSIPTGGANPRIALVGTTFLDCTADFSILHAGTFGTINATAQDEKSTISAGTVGNLAILFSDADGDIEISGELRQRQPDGSFVDTTTLSNQTSSMGILSSGDINPPVSGFVVVVEAGLGYLQKSDNTLVKVTWPDTSFTVSPSTTTYLYFDSNGTLHGSPSFPNIIQNIFIGRVVSDATKILIIEETGVQATHIANSLGTSLRNGLGTVYSSGSNVTEVGTRTLGVSAGEYYYGELQFLANGGSPVTFTSFYQNGTGGFTSVYNQTIVDNAKYDNGTGTLASLTAGYYAKHALYALGDSTGDFDSEAYFVVYSQAQYSALTLAEQGSLPNPPAFLSNAVTLIASIIVQQGATHIVEFLDERPLFASKRVSQIAATTFHHNLQGLNDFDDHLRYLPVDGSRPMTANLPMGGFSITNMLAAISASANPASGGVLRLANLDFIKWRNAANSADIGLQLDASNIFQFGSAITASGNVTAPAHISASSNPSVGGVIRLANADRVNWRNAANSADLSFYLDSSNIFQLGASLNISGTNTANGFVSSSANPASAGLLRLANTEFIKWRNAANTADIGLQLDASNVFQLGSALTVNGNIGATNFSGSSSGTNTGDVTITAFGATPDPKGASISGQAITLQPADATHPGSVSTGAQTFGGAKTFSSVISAAFISSSANPASAGLFELANADRINWRNAGNTADLSFYLDSSNIFQVGSNTNVSGTLTATAHISATANSALTGVLRLANTEAIKWRNAANSADISLSVDASNILQVGSAMTVSGVTSLAAGSVVVPSLNFGDSGTGIYRPGLNQIGFSVGGGSQFQIGSGGVSGTTSLFTNLLVRGTGGNVTINAASGTTTPYTILLPAVQGGVDSLPKNDGSGNLAWITPASAATISTNANSAGVAQNWARSDHAHQITASSALQDQVPQYDGSNWQATYPESLQNIRKVFTMTEDWVAGTASGIFGWVATNTGGGSTSALDTTQLTTNNPGIVNLTGGNAAARAAVLNLGLNHILGGGTFTIECSFKLATLTNAAFRIGLGDVYTGADFNNGVYLEYNSGTSANWLIKTANGGTRTSTTTTVAATANAWHYLLITINAAASSVSYSLDGTSLGTIITNIPASAVGAVISAVSLGVTTTTMFVDYFEMHQRFTTSR